MAEPIQLVRQQDLVTKIVKLGSEIDLALSNDELDLVSDLDQQRTQCLDDLFALAPVQRTGLPYATVKQLKIEVARIDQQIDQLEIKQKCLRQAAKTERRSLNAVAQYLNHQ